MTYSIISWKFWDNWLQKLFVQFISVKVWSLTATIVLCVLGFITGGNLAVIWGVIFGLKGAFQVASVIKNGNGAKKEEIINVV